MTGFRVWESEPMDHDRVIKIVDALFLMDVVVDSSMEFFTHKALPSGFVSDFDSLRADMIFMSPEGSLNEDIPKVAHFLKHREQLDRTGLLVYLVLAYPGWRRWTIEPEALAEESRVARLLANKEA